MPFPKIHSKHPENPLKNLPPLVTSTEEPRQQDKGRWQLCTEPHAVRGTGHPQGRWVTSCHFEAQTSDGDALPKSGAILPVSLQIWGLDPSAWGPQMTQNFCSKSQRLIFFFSFGKGNILRTECNKLRLMGIFTHF